LLWGVRVSNFLFVGSRWIRLTQQTTVCDTPREVDYPRLTVRRMNDDWSDEETDNPLRAADRNFY
jgi:hypothetical protein